MTDSEYISIGRGLVPHGLNGRLKFTVVSDNEERFEIGKRIILRSGGSSAEHRIEAFEWHNGRSAFIKLEGIEDRTAAENVAGAELFITLDEAEKTRFILSEGEFYYFDLVGADVYVKGNLFGKVDDVVDGGAGSLLSIKADGKEYLVPFVDEMVATDRLSAERRIDVTPVDGLFDI